jgi:putative DNA methylase
VVGAAPLAACRAVLFAQLVDDPSAHPDKFPTELEQQAERERLHKIISRLVVWENIHDEGLLEEAHEEILKSTNGNPPSILDPFAGGGSIPLEAQRLGLEARASDLNPVAVLINKALIEIPPKWAGHKPVFPGAVDERMSWPDAMGLAEDVRRYGNWMRDEAEKRIGHLYPKVKVGGVDCTAIAWIWTRTVICPSPACGGTIPLLKSFWLCNKKGGEAYVEPILVVEEKRVRFEIGVPGGVPRAGTLGRSGATCLLCGTPAPLPYIREEGKAGRMGAQLMAIVAEGNRGRFYVSPNEEHEKAADAPRPDDVPEAEIPHNPRYLTAPNYGMRTWADLFTNRQLTTLTTFSDLVADAREKAVNDGASPEYADAVATYLAFCVDKLADTNSTLCTWQISPPRLRPTFSRQAIQMTWDFAEAHPFGRAAGDYALCIVALTKVLDRLPTASMQGHVEQMNAATLPAVESAVYSTDPPYYDNVGYADLSDFFYTWIRRSLRTIYPQLLGTMMTPKADELVADAVRHGSKKKADEFFEGGFNSVFTRIRQRATPEYPITVFYAFKQAENDNDGGHASTGWETLLEGMLTGGWSVTGTWPIRTELGTRTRGQESNALASSIVLACRPRPADAGFTDRRGLIDALRAEFPESLRKLEQGKIAPVDLRQAAIGPGMAVFSRYARVNEPDGSPMRVRAALSLINQVLDEELSQLDGDVSADTRFCVEWFKQYGFEEGPFGTADTLARGVDTGVEGLVRAGVLRSAAGKVKLRSVRDVPDEYTPAADERTSEWEICLHLAKQLDEHGTDAAVRLMGVFEFNRDRAVACLLLVLCRWSGLWASGSAGAGDADAAALVCGVAEAVGVAGLEFGEAVEAFGGGVGDAAGHGGDDLVFPAGYGAREGLQLGDVLVLRAPVVEGEQPVADLPVARCAAGDPGAEPQRVAELLFRDPGDGQLLTGRGGVECLDYLLELLR